MSVADDVLPVDTWNGCSGEVIASDSMALQNDGLASSGDDGLQ